MHLPFSKVLIAIAWRRKFWLTWLIAGTAGFCFIIRDSFSLGEQQSTKPPSVQLHMYIKVNPRKAKELEQRYRTVYVPTIQKQKGFQSSRLLRKIDSANEYEIDIAFASQSLRAAWAQSQDHETAWKKMEETIAKITVQEFNVVD